MNMEYEEIKKIASRVIPGNNPLINGVMRKAKAVREKGRKSNYNQYNLLRKRWEKQERLLKTDQIDSFLEISLRAVGCPMPFNMDVWDGLKCPFRCIYCYADAFRASLYTSFFDNSKTLGLRHCNPDYYKQEIEKMLPLRGKDPHQFSDIRKAFAMEIPIRMGIRFEDFTKNEKNQGISLEMLKYLKEIEYPVMINTKSDLIGEDEYVRALSENPARTAVHITILSSNDSINKMLEPGSPSYAKRIQASKNLINAGVRVVPRIEPYLFLINDKEEDVEKYIQDIKEIGVKNMTFDTYSYTAKNQGIRQNFINRNIDYDRLFTAGCDSQQLGSILLEKYMDLFRKHGISCSTFDLGNVPTNGQFICCEVGDWFQKGWNYGCTVMAIQFIVQNQGKPVTWSQYNDWVMEHGGFLTPLLKQEVHELWNIEGSNIAYSPIWAQGITPIGWDDEGIVWTYLPEIDSRKNLVQSLKGGTDL